MKAVKKTLGLVILTGLTACQKPPEPTPTYGAASNVSTVSKDKNNTPAGELLDCPGLISCISDCSTDACLQTCVNKTSDEGVAQVTALAQCIEDNACGNDESCVETKCAAQINACVKKAAGPSGSTGSTGSSDAFPAQISGTTSDSTEFGGVTLASNANVVFVRDDQAGAAAGYPTNSVAFYRVKSIDYRITTSGSCSDSADRTASDPDAFESNLLIERQPASNGKYKYGMAIGLADGRTSTCNSAIEHYVTTDNTNQPETDLKLFKGSWLLGSRERAWDLKAN